MIPAAPAISITAVFVLSIMPYSQITGSPRGPVTFTCSVFPFIPATRASTVPSPPSARGLTRTSASASTQWMPSAAANPASMDVMLPLKESIAVTTFIVFSSCENFYINQISSFTVRVNLLLFLIIIKLSLYVYIIYTIFLNNFYILLL